VFVKDSVVARTELMRRAEPIIRAAVTRLETLDLDEDEIRRLLENELAVRRAGRDRRRRHA
jgi:hypothetical protein